MRVCIITDNSYIYDNFIRILNHKSHIDAEFDFYYTSWNKAFKEKYGENGLMKPVLLKNQDQSFFDSYDLFISLHCKQLFPEYMVKNYTCINVHPGYNPYNRGWFPQVFSIINKKPIGVTIHLMDAELDHGDILYQKKLEIYPYETSKDVYNRILETEMELMDEHLEEILNSTYTPVKMDSEGNINYKKDFDELCKLDLDEKATYRDVIDRLRALTFSPYENAYFYDEEGNKIYVGITLKKEEK
ncbi:MAG: dTDP-4-amino-4,6-dideoxyglucose formyltransferase [Erysipelotrichaceae bacterium]|nr:dTDP-4-amino-4,6-dideoxyglucose formyltransferase [Erysipelotrichaceae bacterium]